MEDLPPQLSGEELQAQNQEAVATSQATSIKDMGRVMAHLTPLISFRIDGRIGSTSGTEKLSEV